VYALCKFIILTYSKAVLAPNNVYSPKPSHPQESMLAAGIRWLGPGLIALGCGGLAVVLLLAGLFLVLSGTRKREE